MAKVQLKGIIPPLPTIVDARGALDRAGMAMLIERLIRSGVDGLLVLGSTGEFCHMSTAMRKEVAEFALEKVAGRLPVLVGAGTPGTAESIELGKHAAANGAQGILVVNPYYAHLSDEGLYRHYETIAESVGVPVLLYNFPAFTGQDLSADFVKRLALNCPNIIGMKDTIDNFGHTRQIILEVKAARPDFLVFAAFDEYLLPALLIGADGCIPASANFAPEICCGIYSAVQAKDFDRVALLAPRLAKLMSIYSIDTPYFGVVKEAIRLTGSPISTAVLAPALEPSEETKARLVEVLTEAGVLPVG
jgi:4-hydroxy-tetrahydrodipicolinate synthase